MKLKTLFLKLAQLAARSLIAILCVGITLPDHLAGRVEAQQGTTATSMQTTSTQTTEAVQKIPSDQLDSLVAPIALYPDPLLAQVLAASTYPLEIIQLYQWLQKHTDLKDKALADAVMKEPWDPSVQAMATLPDVVKRLADDIQWTADLGNAFLAQQSDVMDAVQRMRKKAEANGNLKPGEQIKVETKTVESKQVIVIEQSNPEVVYVPTYNPTVVYGAPIYPYPPIYYPPPGYYAAGAAISFGVGVAIGAAWGGGGWGWGCGWGNNDIDINVNNNFNRNSNINSNRNFNSNRSGNNTWQHNSSHRGGAPYSDRNTASKYGGNARGESLSGRQSSAQQQVNRQGGNLQSANRPSSSSRSGSSPYSGSSSRSGGSNQVGNRDMSRPAGSSSRSAMGSGSRSSGSYSGSRTRSSSSRGSSSMGSRGGGGRRR
jgi:Protein of unknown function (DUF3300)